ncbi:MAG: endolytic transglycosylase MltG [Acidobacteriota bacterium]
MTLLIIVILLAWLALWIGWQVYSPYKGYEGDEQFVMIYPGYSVPKIARELQENGVIQSVSLFQWYVRLRYGSPSLKAGEYRFDSALSPADVAEKIEEGRVYYHRVTIPEGYSMELILEALVARGLGVRERFESAMQRTQWIQNIDPEAPDLEGYLFPETYLFTRTMTEEQMIRAMVENFRRTWSPERQARAKDLAMKAREVITLASLIEKETGLREERKLVSAVFHNRLEKNIALASDPTVIYGVKQVKEYDGVIHQSDLDLDSPYNTYLYAGLPPGPIASPGLASIDAALYPAEANYLYFVSRNDGSHVFSDNYRAHSDAVRKYQRK